MGPKKLSVRLFIIRLKCYLLISTLLTERATVTPYDSDTLFSSYTGSSMNTMYTCSRVEHVNFNGIW